MEYRDNVFYSPEGNAEIWDQKPEGYLTEKEWFEQHPVPEPEPMTVEQAMEWKKQEFANARYAQEISGVEFGGHKIKTDRESQAMLTGAALQALNDQNYKCRWKCDDGTFVELDRATILAAAVAVRQHVQASFDKEAQKCNELNSLKDVESVMALTW